jgi:hypothetical protein
MKEIALRCSAVASPELGHADYFFAAESPLFIVIREAGSTWLDVAV